MISSDPQNATARKLHSHKIATTLFVPPPANTKDASRKKKQNEKQVRMAQVAGYCGCRRLIVVGLHSLSWGLCQNGFELDCAAPDLLDRVAGVGSVWVSKGAEKKMFAVKPFLKLFEGFEPQN